MSGITVTVKWKNENEKAPRHKTVTVENSNNSYEFYADGEMRDMLTAEQVLNFCNDIYVLFISVLNRFRYSCGSAVAFSAFEYAGCRPPKILRRFAQSLTFHTADGHRPVPQS